MTSRQYSLKAINNLLQERGLLASAGRTHPTRLGVRRFNLPSTRLNGKAIGEVQTALKKLKLDIRPSELARKEFGFDINGNLFGQRWLMRRISQKSELKCLLKI